MFGATSFQLYIRDSKLQDVNQFSDYNIGKAFLDHFIDIYRGHSDCFWLVGNLNWRPISEEQTNNLIQPFTKAEVFYCIKLLGSNKTSGPNDFTIEFFKKYWNNLKGEMMDLFHDFFSNKIVNKSLNATYVALIPKKVHWTKVSDYRLISLTTSIYKILAKVIYERIKQVLPSTIDLQQSAFVHGRQIIDPISVANELVDY